MTRDRTTYDDVSPLRVALLGQGEDLATRVTEAFDSIGVRVALKRVDDVDAVEDALVRFRAHVVLAEISNARRAIWSAYRVVRAIRPSAPFILLTQTLDEDAFLSFSRYNPDDVVLVENLARLVPAVQRALDHRQSLAKLSPRQIEVLVWVAEGRRTREIAERLGRSAKTVESHRSAMMKRLGLADVAAVVRFAVRMGLVPADLFDGRGPRTIKGLQPAVPKTQSPTDLRESGGAEQQARGAGNYGNYQR
jgi:DNA-binding NarL/FixJ family response regulator